ncbi:MAG: hypothetical protein ACRDFX_12005 [Chloroflexota bacterium]
MRRLPIAIPFLALAVVLGGPSVSASAASWQHFVSKSLGFSLRYPRGWSRHAVDQLGSRQLLLSNRKNQAYAFSVTIIPIKAGASSAQTLHRFVRYERGLGNTTLASIHWSKAQVGHRAAESGVLRPATEGGVGLAQGVYVASWKSRVYEISVTAYGKHVPSKLGGFPAVYARILATWRFI